MRRIESRMRRRVSGRERRAQRRRARERGSLIWLLTRVGPAVAAAVALMVALVVATLWLLSTFVLDGESGPPPVPGELIFTETGLGIIDIEVGAGPTPEPGDGVAVSYTGWLSDGTKFDSSLDRGEPFEFIIGAGRVIKGWDEGVLGMRVHGKRRLIIPPELAYGEEGWPPMVPPNAEVTFDIELLAFK